MTTTTEQINLWLATPKETQNLEFKEAKASYDNEKLFKYCVALSNEGGGHFVLGINDAKPRVVVGSNAYPDLVKITEILFNNLGFRVDVEMVAHPNGRVLVFHIPSRNRGSARSYQGAYWMRSGENLVAMTEEQLRKIFSEGQPDWLEEASLTNVDATAIVELLDTQTYFELIKQPYPASRESVIDKLIQERYIDKTTSGYAIRRITGLLLAKSLNSFPELARKAPRVIVYEENNKLNTRIDQTGSRGYAVGFQGLVKFIMEQLPQNEIIEDALRKKVKLVPEVVIRELVANALIHQDISTTGTSPMIEIYSNRIEISNPGVPIINIDRFIDGHQSRNERLADLMRRMYICEEKSSGVDRVIDAAEKFQLPAPSFYSLNHRTYVTIFGPKPFEDMDRDDRVRACYQHAALRWVMAQRMTNQSLRERFHLPEKRAQSISQIIALAIDAKLIAPDEKVGASRKFARYIPIWAA